MFEDDLNKCKYTGWSGMDINVLDEDGSIICKLGGFAFSRTREMGPVYVMPGAPLSQYKTTIAGTLIFKTVPEVLPEKLRVQILAAREDGSQVCRDFWDIEILHIDDKGAHVTPAIVEPDYQYTFIAKDGRNFTPWREVV